MNFVKDNSSIDTAIIEIGGEGPIGQAPGGTDEYMDIMGKVAKEYNAPIFALEHRFYGKS